MASFTLIHQPSHFLVSANHHCRRWRLPSQVSRLHLCSRFSLFLYWVFDYASLLLQQAIAVTSNRPIIRAEISAASANGAAASATLELPDSPSSPSSFPFFQPPAQLEETPASKVLSAVLSLIIINILLLGKKIQSLIH